MIQQTIAANAAVQAKTYEKAQRLNWVLYIKGIAFILIFIDHIAERLFGYTYFANPNVGMPSLMGRIAEFKPISGFGILLGIPINALRYIGWNGAQTTQLFLIISGFGLTWGLLARYGTGPIDVKEFYRRRAWRIYPLWWGAHVFFIGMYLVTGWGMPVDSSLALSLIGLRITPETIYGFTTAWWYFGTMIQLYLFYPVFWFLLRRLGPLKLLIVLTALNIVVRGAGFLSLHPYTDAWNRGAIFITQMAGFVFGISLAVWLREAPDQTNRWLCKPQTVIAAIAMYGLGTVLDFTLLGMAVTPVLRGLGEFIFLYALIDWLKRKQVGREIKPVKWLGQHSYALFLIHQPFITLFVPSKLTPQNLQQALEGIALAAVVGIGAAIVLERVVNNCIATLGNWFKSLGFRKTIRRIGIAASILVVVLLGCEFVLGKTVASGSDEQIILQPHPEFGWKFTPSSELYVYKDADNYRITANSLGFPGVEYPPHKADNTLRILTIGDAFTSADGVDTGNTWPYLLEKRLAARLPSREVQVMNFAVPGYGPREFAAVMQHYLPIYKPDLIIVAFSVESPQNELRTPDQAETILELNHPPLDKWVSVLRLEYLRRLIKQEILDLAANVVEWIGYGPNPNGYVLGNFVTVERNQSKSKLNTTQRLLTEHLAGIQGSAHGVNAKVITLMIPAAIQVCNPQQLAYFPRYVDLADTRQYDVNLPQSMVQHSADALQLPYFELRQVLREKSQNTCVYQQHNKYWLLSGHQAAADYLTDVLITDGYVDK